MRRLPIFLVIDVSESMAGTPIENVQKGICDLQAALMSDPYAMETAYLSVITFAGKAKVVTPLTYLPSFTAPDLPIGSGTSLSEALDVLMTEIEHNVKKNTPESKGDWRPLVFLLTDGSPTDRYQNMVKKWHQKYDGKVNIIAILMGSASDASALRSLTETVLVFRDTSPESYRAFFKWVSSSIQSCSKEIGENGNQKMAERFPDELEEYLQQENLPSRNATEYFVIPARCMNTKELFIVRVKKHKEERFYQYDGAYKVDESYFELSAKGSDKSSLPTSAIEGNPPSCPYCGNKDFGQAACGKCHCMDLTKPHNVKCPWCGDVADYEVSEFSMKGGRD